MVNIRSLAAHVAYASLIGTSVAHPGEPAEEVRRELAALKATRPLTRRAIRAHVNAPSTAALRARTVARRAEAADRLRKARGITHKPLKSKRDEEGFEKWSAVDHDVSDLGYDLDTPLDTIFSSNASASLVPEVTIGPYWVGGEFIRTNITDGQAGIPVHLDMQFIDVNTSEPIETGTLVDIWACNATGVYAGVNSMGQGGLNTTHGRGVQLTDDDGVVEFDTIFPGWYTGRTPHYHIMTTAGATLLSNGTYTWDSGTPTHIGQLFFDQSLITESGTFAPYTSNEQTLTLNSEDDIGISEATVDYDPFTDYVRLGDSLDDGLLMFITVFVDSTADQSDSRTPAAIYYSGGGVATNNTGMPGGPGGGGPPPSL